MSKSVITVVKSSSAKVKGWITKHKKLSIAIIIVWLLIGVGAASGNTAQPTKSAGATKQTADKVTFSQVTGTEPIPFQTTTQNDSTLPKGQTKVIKAGQDGVSTVTYMVSYTNGKETYRKAISQVTTTPPVDEIDAVGTYVAPLLDISGTGTRQTQKFTTTGDWTMTYTFDCSNFGMQGNFQVYIYNDDGSLDYSDSGPNDLATKGGTTDYYYDSGTHYLSINSECDWHVTVNQ